MRFDTYEIADDDEITRIGLEMVGEMVRSRRRELRLTQRQVESLTGIDQTLISRIENGRIRGVKFKRFARLVGALGGLWPEDRRPRWLDPRPIIRLDVPIAADDPRLAFDDLDAEVDLDAEIEADGPPSRDRPW